MSAFVERVMAKRAKSILQGYAVCVPDDPKEMNWRLFFAHSQDMQGFRADIFTGGKYEGDNPKDPAYLGLRDRWKDSCEMLEGLACLWENPAAQKMLCHHSNRFRSEEEKRAGIRPCMEILRGPYGNAVTQVFADALEALSGDRIARSTNAMIRSYAQNAALLRPHNFYFRNYLLYIHPLPFSNPDKIKEAEETWIMRLQQDMYNVGPALSNYLICDWLLGFWRAGYIPWFQSFKEDSVFLRTLAEAGKLPEEAVQNFVEYCRSLKMKEEWTPQEYPALLGKPVPPRLLNEAIWLEENRSSQ